LRCAPLITTLSISATKGLIRLPDPMIMAKALAESRIVLTFDLDFETFLRLQAAKVRASSSFDSETRRPPP